MHSDRFEEVQANITTADLAVTSADLHLVFVSTFMVMVSAVLQLGFIVNAATTAAVVFLSALPIIALASGGLAALSAHTPTKLQLALIAQVSALPGAVLVIATMIGAVVSKRDGFTLFGLIEAEALRAMSSSGAVEFVGLLFVCAVPILAILFFSPAFWRLLRRAYPPAAARLLRSALQTQNSAPRQHMRFSLWCVPLLLSVPPLLFISFLGHLLVRPFGGPFHNRLSLSPQYPIGWIKAFVRFYKRKTQLQAKEALAHDGRVPILLLRSFADEGVTYTPPEILQQSPRLASLETFRFQLEDCLARELSRKGPPVAIGAPGELLPPVGAYRQYCSEDEWRAVVLSRMAEAQAVVVIASQTKWLSWELDQIVRNNHIGKCMIFFPPLTPDAHADRVEAVLRAISPNAPADIAASGLVALLFHPSGPVTAVVDQKQSKQSYVLAVQAGLAP